jgi:hypothetical protein
MHSVIAICQRLFFLWGGGGLSHRGSKDFVKTISAASATERHLIMPEGVFRTYLVCNDLIDLGLLK